MPSVAAPNVKPDCPGVANKNLDDVLSQVNTFPSSEAPGVPTLTSLISSMPVLLKSNIPTSPA